VDNGFHDFTDPLAAFKELFDEIREADPDDLSMMDRVMDTLALSLMHIGIDQHTYDITMPYCACMFALGQPELGRAIGKVTLRIGKEMIGVAYAVRREDFQQGLSSLTNTQKEAMTTGIVCCLQGMGADVGIDGEVISIKSWHCDNPDHDHPVHGVGATLDIDKTVSEFREELDEVLGDSEDPMARWRPRPKKEDK